MTHASSLSAVSASSTGRRAWFGWFALVFLVFSQVTAILISLAWSAHATRYVRHVATLREMLKDVPAFVHQVTVLFADAVLAFPGTDGSKPLEGLALLAVFAVIIGVIIFALRGPIGDMVTRDYLRSELEKLGDRLTERVIRPVDD